MCYSLDWPSVISRIRYLTSKTRQTDVHCICDRMRNGALKNGLLQAATTRPVLSIETDTRIRWVAGVMCTISLHPRLCLHTEFCLRCLYLTIQVSPSWHVKRTWSGASAQLSYACETPTRLERTWRCTAHAAFHPPSNHILLPVSMLIYYMGKSRLILWYCIRYSAVFLSLSNANDHRPWNI